MRKPGKSARRWRTLWSRCSFRSLPSVPRPATCRRLARAISSWSLAASLLWCSACSTSGQPTPPPAASACRLGPLIYQTELMTESETEALRATLPLDGLIPMLAIRCRF